MSDSENDSDEWSDAEYFDDLGAFDLVYLNENEGDHIERIIDDRYSSDDEDNWQFSDYVAPEIFFWD